MFVRTILYSWKRLHKRSERTQECSPERLLERFWKRLHKRLECTQQRKNVLVHSDNDFYSCELHCKHFGGFGIP